MKKTLTIAALLGILYASVPCSATIHWADGVTCDLTTGMATGAYTSYKHNAVSGDDSQLCWAASAANLIAWWQDRVEENGAIIIPDGTPRGYKVWEEVRLNWGNHGGWAPATIQHWIHGETIQCSYDSRTEQGLQAKGYYNRIAGAEYSIYNYHGQKDFLPEGGLVSTYYVSGNNGHNFAGAAKWLADGFDNGDCFAFATGKHVMTVYGVDYDENSGTFAKEPNFFWSDNNNTADPYPQNKLVRGEAYTGDDGRYLYVYGAVGGVVLYLYGIHTTGIHFNDYDVVRNGTRTDDMFSHYCNLIIDDGQEFALEYDLRSADENDSPVTPYIYHYNSEDNRIVDSKEKVTTGDIKLHSGTLSLVDCNKGREKLDGGGSTTGTISFLASETGDDTRTLKVDRTATIAGTLKISTQSGNELEVTGSNTASFGTLTGEGNLDKTGTGSAEVTETLSLKGAINVKEGHFVFGESATIGGVTVLNVFSAAQVESKSGSAVTLTLEAGIHTNDGVMALTSTVKTGATLKGSGTFAAVTVDGGTLIVGNSPGQQTYTGDLAVNLGDIVFSVDGWDTAADATTAGWGNGVYSNINMGNNAFTVGNDGNIIIALSDEASQALTMGTGELDLTLISNMGNTLSEDELQGLMLRTSFMLSGEQKDALDTPLALNLSKAAYLMRDNALILTSLAGTDNPVPPAPVPEPATGTLGLLALAALAGRRRRK